MCGVVGIATARRNGFTQNETNAFQDMLFLDTMRGFDSTGVMGMDKHGNVVVHKEASHGLDFIRTPEFKSFKDDLFRTGVFAAGHNRAATRGTIIDKNAHPFVIDDKIVLMQNGTYKGSHKQLKDTEVDTEAVAHCIAEHADVEEALKKVNASYTLVWFDVENKRLNLIRNSERPLWLLETDEGALMWASEASFLYMAANRNGIKFTKKAEEAGEHVLISLTINDNTWKREDKKLQCAYKFQWTQEHDFHSVYDSWDIPHRRSQRTPIVQHQSRLPHFGAVNKDHVQDSLCDIIAGDKFIQHHIAWEKAAKVQKEITELDWQKPHPVEIIDYVPANANPACTCWHVFGNLVRPPGGMAELAVVGFVVHGKKEEDVLQIVGNSWYTCKISTTRSHNNGNGFGVVTVLGHSLTPYNQPVELPQ